MNVNDELLPFKAIGLLLCIFLIIAISSISLDWYHLDLSESWEKSFFQNSFLSIRTAVCLVALSTLATALSPISPFYGMANLGKLMLIETLLIGVIAGLMYLYFSYGYNLSIIFYDSTLNAMSIGAVLGLIIIWGIRYILLLPVYQSRYYRY
jgi:uncharacterized integral membrane protein